MVFARLEDAGMLAAVEAGACGILRRSEAAADRVAEAVITAANGDGSGPPALGGRCLQQMRAEAAAEGVAGAVITAANGDGSVPPDLLGRLLNQMSRLQRQVLAPRGLSVSRFRGREGAVVQLP